MAVYARFGETVKVLRYATKEDVLKLDPPFDKEAQQNLENKSWVVIEFEDGREWISHLAYLRADGALPEIMNALKPSEPDRESDDESSLTSDQLADNRRWDEGREAHGR